VEVSHVNKRLKIAMEQARSRAQTRRQRTAEADQAFAAFLEHVATPVARQTASALKAAGLGFTVATPEGGLRLSSERGRDDFIEFALDTSGPEPQVVGRVRATRGSRTSDETMPVKAATAPEELTDEDVLDFLLRALEPWLER
jgi:hypothetical protein